MGLESELIKTSDPVNCPIKECRLLNEDGTPYTPSTSNHISIQGTKIDFSRSVIHGWSQKVKKECNTEKRLQVLQTNAFEVRQSSKCF